MSLLKSKNIFASKTLWGIAVAGASIAAQQYGFSLSPGTQAAVVDKLATVGEAGGLTLAWLGRFAAERGINVLGK